MTLDSISPQVSERIAAALRACEAMAEASDAGEYRRDRKALQAASDELDRLYGDLTDAEKEQFRELEGVAEERRSAAKKARAASDAEEQAALAKAEREERLARELAEKIATCDACQGIAFHPSHFGYGSPERNPYGAKLTIPACGLRRPDEDHDCTHAEAFHAEAKAWRADAWRNLALRWIDEHLPARLREARFDTLTIDRHNRKAVEVCQAWAAGTGPAPLLIGPCGTGKSWILGATLAARALGKATDTHYLASATDYLQQRKRIMSLADRSDRDAEQDALDSYLTAKRLILDDLAEATVSDWARTEIGSLVDTRYREGRETAFASNYDLDTIGREDCWGPRTASRLREMAAVVRVTGPDRRKSAGGADAD